MSDALLVSRGYPTSFIHPFSRVQIRRFGRCNVDGLMLAECDPIRMAATVSSLGDQWVGGSKLSHDWSAVYASTV